MDSDETVMIYGGFGAPCNSPSCTLQFLSHPRFLSLSSSRDLVHPPPLFFSLISLPLPFSLSRPYVRSTALVLARAVQLSIPLTVASLLIAVRMFRLSQPRNSVNLVQLIHSLV